MAIVCQRYNNANIPTSDTVAYPIAFMQGREFNYSLLLKERKEFKKIKRKVKLVNENAYLHYPLILLVIMCLTCFAQKHVPRL